VRLKDDNLAGALSDLDNAIKLDPKFARAYPNRGNVKLSRGDLDGAIADYDRAIDLDPKLAVAYFNRERAYDKKGDASKAIADYTRAIELDPKYRGRMSFEAIPPGRKETNPKAIVDYTRAIELDSNSGQYSKAARPLRKQRKITREPRPITGAPANSKIRKSSPRRGGRVLHQLQFVSPSAR
jgi:tetratricopeptide (TPR) repeat protein